MDAQQAISKNTIRLITAMFAEWTKPLTTLTETCSYEYKELDIFLNTEPSIYDFQVWCDQKIQDWLLVAKILEQEGEPFGDPKRLAGVFERLVVVAEKEAI